MIFRTNVKVPAFSPRLMTQGKTSAILETLILFYVSETDTEQKKPLSLKSRLHPML